MRKRVSRPGGPVFPVTGLPASLRDDQNARMRRYLLSMGIRTVCFVLAVGALGVLHWAVVGWTLVTAAVILPYIAVVVANAARPKVGTFLSPVTPKEGAVPEISPPQISPRRPNEESPDEHGHLRPPGPTPA